MKKQVGIWLDFKEANIITLENNKAKVSNIQSEIEDFHPKGGARSKQPWGPMHKISEKKYLMRRQQQMATYFQKLMTLTQNADELFIFGPAEAKHDFAKAIQNNNSFKPDFKDLEPSDSITENQKIARVKAFFNK